MNAFRHDIEWHPSPNFSSREGYSQEGTVIHYTAGGRASGSISWLCNKLAKASAHFVISRVGKTVQLVDLAKAAWHAGVSEMRYKGEMKRGANRFTIGIELANHGLLHKDRHGRYWYELGRELRLYKCAEPVKATLVYDNGNQVEGWWEPYADEQIEALLDLLKGLKEAGHKIDPIVGHEEVAVPFGTRKMDPGGVFPWHRLGRPEGRRTLIARDEVA